MRPKLNGMSLTFRLSEEQSKLVERAMEIEKTSNTSEFVRRVLLKGAQEIVNVQEMTDARRKALKSRIERENYPFPSDDLQMKVAEDPPSAGQTG